MGRHLGFCPRARSAVAVIGALVLALATTACAPTGDPPVLANAPTPATGHRLDSQCDHRPIPASQISFQLYSARALLDEAGHDAALATLADLGYRNVELAAPVGSYDLPLPELQESLTAHDLESPSGHGAYDETTFASQHLPAAAAIGQRYTGSGGFGTPGTDTLEHTLATAEQLNRLGERSVANGTGKLFGHNHDGEFRQVFPDPESGEPKSAWQLLVEHTDPRYVTFELDVFWAEAAGVDVVALLEEYGDRIELLHLKDGKEPFDPANQTALGDGDIDWGPILAAAEDTVELYVVERDNGPEPVEEFAERSFDFLTCEG